MSDQTPAQRPPSSGGGGGANANRSRNNRNRNQNRSRSGGGGGGGNQGGQSRSGGNGNRSGGQPSRNRSGGGQNRSRPAAPRTAAPPEVLAPLVLEPGLGATEVLPAEAAETRRRAIALCVYTGLIPALVVGGAVAAVMPLIGVVAFVVIAVVVAFGLWRTAPGAAIGRIGAVPLSRHDNPRLFNVTEGLCATFGLRMPALFVVFDAVPNACALGRDTMSSDLVVTSGLLDALDPIQLEGVIAHELAHVKRGDNGVSSIALTLGRFGGEGLVRRCVGKNREYRADVVSASAVRFPRGLLEALRLMEASPGPAGNSIFGADRFGASRWIWIDPSIGHREVPIVPGDLDATSVRVAALSEW